jgi:phosphate-selective porin OprO/OprP
MTLPLRWPWAGCYALAMLAALSAAPLYSQEPPEGGPVEYLAPAPKTDAERIAALEKQVADLTKKAKAADKKAEEGWVDLSNEKWNVKMGGNVQMDYINWAKNPPQIPGQNYYEFRRLRLTADGTGYGVYDFRLQMTLEPETIGESNGQATSPDVKDAYFSLNEIPLIGRARIGNFFVPFGLEQVTNDTLNIFMERSIPTQGIFTADRELGVAFYNCTEDKNLSWTTGMFLDNFSDTLKERIDDNQGYRLSGRVVYVPYYDEPSNGRYVVHTGLGILHTDDQDDRVRFRARPQIHEGPRLIDSGQIVADSYTTGNAEFAVVWGNVTLQSEMFISSVNTIGPNQTVNGCYAHLSYFLTGENRVYERFGQHGAQFGRNQPFTNFFAVPGAVGSGAWEMKARWSHLDLNSIDKGQYNDYTFGFNWYWSDRVRVMFDWIHPYTSSETPFGKTESDILAMRFDWNW